MKLLSVLALFGAALLQAATPTVAIVNQTKGVTDANLQSYMNAIKQQVNAEYMAAWKNSSLGSTTTYGGTVNFRFVGRGQATVSGDWNVYIDERKGDYHTVSRGVPVAYCHVNGVSLDYWTNTISHEVLEMLTDPMVNMYAYQQDGSRHSVEVCDACEQNDQGYRISGVLMSDFVYPNWFVWSAPTSSQFDQTKLIHAPWTLLPGGYMP